MKTIISIIVPCFNQAHFLDECLLSIINQEYKFWECIIVNDGSIDNTEKTAKKWIEKDNRFYYIYKENGGLSSARNFGINHSKGTYILPLDADDKITPNYLNLAIDAFSKNQKLGIVYSRAMNFGSYQNEWLLPEYSFKKLLLNNMIFCSAIFKKELWFVANGYDESFKNGWEDWEFWINAISKTNVDVYKLNTVCFYYRRKEDSMLKGLNYNKEEQKKIKNKVYSKHILVYSKYYPTAIDSFSINEYYNSKMEKWKKNILYKFYKFFNKR